MGDAAGSDWLKNSVKKFEATQQPEEAMVSRSMKGRKVDDLGCAPQQCNQADLQRPSDEAEAGLMWHTGHARHTVACRLTAAWAATVAEQSVHLEVLAVTTVAALR